ncbi:zinc knuckle CX2CX4HX4C containing protein [Tanacetum coccineum]
MSNTSDKGTMFRDGAARVRMQLRSSPKVIPLTTVDDLQKLINDIDAGKHDELLSKLTNKDRMEILEALGSICNSIKVDRNNADVIPCKVSYADDSINLNVDESTIPSDPIVQSVDINKSTSYAGVAGGIVEKVSTRFEHTLYGYFIGKRMAFPVVEYYARNNWAKHGLKRIMMNSKGFFFFKFDSRAGLEAVLEGGPWLIRKSSVHSRNGDLVDVVTIGIPSLSEDDFTKETIRVEYEWRPPRCDIYEEDVENVYDESANLIQNTKAGGSSSFTAATG